MLLQTFISSIISYFTDCWLLGSVLLLGLWFWYWWVTPSQFPPGRRGLPVVGVMPYLGKHPQKVFLKWAQDYGPVMFVRMGGKDIVFLNTVDAITEALVKQKSVFSGRPLIKLYNQVLGENGMTFMDYNEKQKLSKKLALHSLRRLGLGKIEMENRINSEAEHFVEYLLNKQHQSLDLEMELSGILCNIMTSLVIGKRFKYDDPVLKAILKEGVFLPGDPQLKLILMYFYDYVRFFPPFKRTNERFIQGELKAADELRVFIEEHKRHFDPSQLNDFVDMFLYEREYGKENLDRILTDKQLEGCVRDIILAGSNDLRLLLRWDVLCLLNYRDYHDKIIDEIESIIGFHNRPSLTHFKEMPITQAFLQEIWRYCPAVPNGVLHYASADTKLYNFHLPKGTHVVPNIYAAHFDPSIWNNPEIFDPERHLNHNGQFVRSHNIIPCSVGPRFCLGRDIAHDEEFLILVNLLQKFNITSASDPLPPINTGVTTLVYSPLSYKIKLIAR